MLNRLVHKPVYWPLLAIAAVLLGALCLFSLQGCGAGNIFDNLAEWAGIRDAADSAAKCKNAAAAGGGKSEFRWALRVLLVLPALLCILIGIAGFLLKGIPVVGPFLPTGQAAIRAVVVGIALGVGYGVAVSLYEPAIWVIGIGSAIGLLAWGVPRVIRVWKDAQRASGIDFKWDGVDAPDSGVGGGSGAGPADSAGDSVGVQNGPGSSGGGAS